MGSSFNESFSSIIDNEVESESEIADEEYGDYGGYDDEEETPEIMECTSDHNSGGSGNSSLDLSLKQMSSNIIDSAKNSIQKMELPKKIYDSDGQSSPPVID